MRVGCPKEIKNHEYRVGLTPESARELVNRGHEVWIESGALTSARFRHHQKEISQLFGPLNCSVLSDKSRPPRPERVTVQPEKSLS